VHNWLAAEQCGRYPEVGIHQPANDKGKEKEKQVKPALRLPAGRYGVLKGKHTS